MEKLTETEGAQRRWRMRMLFLHGTLLLVSTALWALHKYARVDLLGICLFNALFTVDCPARGITRSIAALFSGHLRDAIVFHPEWPLVVGIVGALVLYFGAVLLTGHRKRLEWRKEIVVYRVLEVLAAGARVVG